MLARLVHKASHSRVLTQLSSLSKSQRHYSPLSHSPPPLPSLNPTTASTSTSTSFTCFHSLRTFSSTSGSNNNNNSNNKNTKEDDIWKFSQEVEEKFNSHSLFTREEEEDPNHKPGVIGFHEEDKDNDGDMFATPGTGCKGDATWLTSETEYKPWSFDDDDNVDAERRTGGGQFFDALEIPAAEANGEGEIRRSSEEEEENKLKLQIEEKELRAVLKGNPT